MNSDSESLQHQLLAWLTAENAATNNHLLVDCEENQGVKNLDTQTAASRSGDFKSQWMPHTFQLGEIPTVQERFQAVLKRRLKVQIENHPPIFPWESQLTEYPECIDTRAVELVPAWGWTAQQHKLNLPTLLPERIFQQLLEKCQALLGSSLPIGAKLVQAVENFFPEDSQTLNDLAGLVLRSTYRSGDTLESMTNLEDSYSDMQPPQQMALSLMAAKQLLDYLTVPISASSPVVERQWLTSMGVVNLKLEYHCQQGNLRISAELPTKGILKLKGDGSQAMAQSTSPGCLSVELSYTRLNQTYTLEVNLDAIDEQPLLFVIIPTM
jgi:hypothetical protein